MSNSYMGAVVNWTPLWQTMGVTAIIFAGLALVTETITNIFRIEKTPR